VIVHYWTTAISILDNLARIPDPVRPVKGSGYVKYAELYMNYNVFYIVNDVAVFVEVMII
jgi:hypothetical protein